MPTSEENVVDAFFIDITDIHKFQTHLKAMNHKLAMALEAAIFYRGDIIWLKRRLSMSRKYIREII